MVIKVTFIERDVLVNEPVYVASFEAVVLVDGRPLSFYTDVNLAQAQELFGEASLWCEENFGDYWYDADPRDEKIHFYTLREATAFKLRWC